MVCVVTSCNTVKVINTDSEPVPVKVTGQPIQTSITNDLSSVKVNNKPNEPIPVTITNPNPNPGTQLDDRIFFRMVVNSTTPSSKIPFEPTASDVVTGTLPTKPYNYVVTAVYGNGTHCSFFANNVPYNIKYTENVMGFLPCSTSDKMYIQPNGGVTVVGYIFK